MVEGVRTPLVLLDPEYTIVAANPAFEQLHDLPAGPLGHDFFEVAGGAWNDPRLRSGLDEVIRGQGEVRNLRVDLTDSNGGLNFLVDARQLRTDDDARQLIVLTLEDITLQRSYEKELERYTRELKRSNRALESF